VAYEWIYLAIVVFIFILSASPLNRAVKIMKGKTTFWKTLFVMIVSGLVIGVLASLLPFWSGLIAFIVLVWIYKKAFKLKWYSAVGVWILHLVFVIISAIVLSFILKALTDINLFFS